VCRHFCFALVLGVVLLCCPPVGAADTDRFGESLPSHAVARLESARLRGASARLTGMGMVWGVALSPDGKRLLAVVGPDETICLREAATGKLVRSRTGAKGGCYALAFSPDGTLLAAGDNHYGQSSNPRGRVLLWEVAGGKLTRTFAGHNNTIRSVAFSPDGKRIVLGCRDGLRVWDVGSGKQILRRSGSRQFIDALAFTGDGKQLVAGGDAAIVWDLSSGEEVRRLGGEHGWVAGVALSAGDRLLARRQAVGLRRSGPGHSHLGFFDG
jgi:WD40 repeat protein